MILVQMWREKKSSLKIGSVCFNPKPPRPCDQRPRMNFWVLLKRQTMREKEPQKGLARAAKGLGLFKGGVIENSSSVSLKIKVKTELVLARRRRSQTGRLQAAGLKTSVGSEEGATAPTFSKRNCVCPSHSASSRATRSTAAARH